MHLYIHLKLYKIMTTYYIYYIVSFICIAFLYIYKRFAKGGILKTPYKYERGLVIGKFYPPHLGHNYLINIALQHCASLIIIVCQRPTEAPSGALRYEYLTKLHGNCKNLYKMILIDDIYDQNDSELWAKLCTEWIRPYYKHTYKPPLIQAVFTSESYGDPFAHYLSIYMFSTVKHHLVDIYRSKIPISGSKIRKDPYKYLLYMSPIVRNFYIKRIVIYGFDDAILTNIASKIKGVYLDVKKLIKINELHDILLCKDHISPEAMAIISNDDGLIRSIYIDNTLLENYEVYRKQLDTIMYIVKEPDLYNKLITYTNKFNIYVKHINNNSEISQQILPLISI